MLGSYPEQAFAREDSACGVDDPMFAISWLSSYKHISATYRYSPEIFLHKPWRPWSCGFCQFEIIINFLVSSFRLIGIPLLWVYGHYKCSTLSVRGSTLDVRVWRLLTSDSDMSLKSVPALKGLNIYNDRIYNDRIYNELLSQTTMLFSPPWTPCSKSLTPRWDNVSFIRIIFCRPLLDPKELSELLLSTDTFTWFSVWRIAKSLFLDICIVSYLSQHLTLWPLSPVVALQFNFYDKIDFLTIITCTCK